MTLPYPPPYQDIEVLAEHLSLTPRTIDEWTKIGKLPAPRVVVDGTKLWKWADVVACQPKLARQGTIYFLRCEQFVKIGFTQALSTRLRSLEGANPMPISVIHTMPGGVDDEASLLLKFAHLKHRGEWFAATQEILDFIADLKGSE